MIRYCTPFALLLLYASFTCANQSDNELFEEIVDVMKMCQDTPVTLCVKERAVKMMDTMPNEYDFGNGFMLRPHLGFKRSARFITTLPEEDNIAREAMVDNVLIERIADYLSGHTFQFKLPENVLGELKRSLDVEEGRKKKKKGVPLFLLLKMKAAAFGAIILKMIGFVALKALMLAKLSLVFASIMLLKKLVESKHHNSASYEIISAHPYEQHGHSFDRSFTDTAYHGYDPKIRS